MNQILLQIHNHHGPRSGTPPQIEERPGQYLGYFENEYNEQMIFVFDRDSGTGWLYAGDVGWETPHQVVDGRVEELVLDTAEELWLRACWSAAIGSG